MEKFNAMRTRLLQHLQKKAIRSRSIMTLVCLLLTSTSVFAQTKTVTGTVTDAANEPLIGASVLVQGTSTGPSRIWTVNIQSLSHRRTYWHFHTWG